VRFLAIQKEMFPQEQVRELQHLSDTRWWCRARPCENALLRLKCIVALLEETSADDTGARAVSARELLAQVDAEFVYLLHFFTAILDKVEKVSKLLQEKQTNLAKATDLISSLRDLLAGMRKSDLGEQYSEKVDRLCNECNISSRAVRKRTKIPRRLDEFVVMETTGERSSDLHPVHTSIFYSVLDCLMSEIDNRFSKDSVAIFAGISSPRHIPAFIQ